MQYFIDSLEAFNKLMELSEKFEKGKDMCTNAYVTYPNDYSIKDDIVHICYSIVCDLATPEDYFGNKSEINITQSDLEFLNNLLGDYLDESYFSNEFVVEFIHEKYEEYSRIIPLEIPHFFQLCAVYDSNKKSKFYSRMIRLLDAIANAYLDCIIERSTFPEDFDRDDFFERQKANLFDLYDVIRAINVSSRDVKKTYNAIHPEVKKFFNKWDVVEDPQTSRSNAADGVFDSPIRGDGSRENPIIQGQTVILNSYSCKLEATVLEIMRGRKAKQFYENIEEYPDELSDSMEFLLIKLKIKALEAEKDVLTNWDYSFSLFSSLGREYEYFVTPSEIRLHEMFVGTEQSGYILFQVSQNDQFPCIRFNGDPDVWFSAVPIQTSQSASAERMSDSGGGDGLSENPIIPGQTVIQMSQRAATDDVVSDSPAGGDGSKENPIVPGQTVIINSCWNDYKLEATLLEITRGKKAKAFYESVYRYPRDLAGSMELLMVKFRIKALKASGDYISSIGDRFHLFSLLGRKYDYFVTPSEIGLHEMFVGTEQSGYVLFQVDQDDQCPRILFYGDPDVWFSAIPAQTSQNTVAEVKDAHTNKRIAADGSSDFMAEGDGSRKNPIVIGQTVILNTNSCKLEATLLEIMRGKKAKAFYENVVGFSYDLAGSMEFLLAKFRIKTLETRDDSISNPGHAFDLVSPSGREYEYFVTPEEIGLHEMFVGTEQSGYVLFQVAQNDQCPCIRFGRKAAVWFSAMPTVF